MVTSGEPSKELVVHDTSQQKESHRSTSSVHSYREGTSPVIPQKPSEDGYSWRKYGQKNVKGNEFIRSYYKCSYYNCQVKKQVQRAHDGRITDTTYFGNHEHPKSLSNLQPALPSLLSAQVQIPDHPSTVAEDKSFDPHDPNTDVTKAKDCHELAIVQVNDESTQAVSSTRASNIENRIKKRRKKGINIVEARLEKPSDESRLVVETVCAVDIVNDGYRWRKYGQKLVKGNPNPRSYYRCSHSGCPAKKHVERASRDPKVVITTYEGQHDHDLPPTRAIVPHRPLTSGTSPLDGVNKSKSEEIKAERNGSSIHKRPRNDSSKRKRPEEGCFSDDGEKKEEKDEAMAVSQTRTLDNEREVPTVFSQLTTVKKGEKEVYADFETVSQANSAKKACVNKSQSEETEAERNGSSKHERLEEGNLNDDGEKDESMFVAQIRTLEEQLKVPTVVTQETTVKKEVKEVYVDFETVNQVNSIKEEEKTTMSVDVVTGVSAVKKDGGDTKLEADSVGQNPADQSASGEQQKPDTVITPSGFKSKEDEQRIPDVKLNSSCPDIKQPKADAETVNC